MGRTKLSKPGGKRTRTEREEKAQEARKAAVVDQHASDNDSDSDNDDSDTSSSRSRAGAAATNGRHNGHSASPQVNGRHAAADGADESSDDSETLSDILNSSDDSSDDETEDSSSRSKASSSNGSAPSTPTSSRSTSSSSADKTAVKKEKSASASASDSAENGGDELGSDSDSDSDLEDTSDEEEAQAAIEAQSMRRVSSLTAGQHEDESDDEFALMRCDEPYPPMDFQNLSRCQRFIKKTATNIKRVFMKKIVRRQRHIRRRYKEEGKSSAEAEADAAFVKLQHEFKTLEKFPIALLCSLSWEFYWYKNKLVRFPKDEAAPLSADMKRLLSAGLQHTMMRLAFQQLIRAHLHKLKRQARKIIKAVNRQERKDEKFVKQNKVKELSDLLAEGRMPVKQQNVDQLKVGQIVDAIVDGVTPTGVFAVFWRSAEQIRGMIHVSELSEQYTADPAAVFHIGDKLNPVIINVDPVRHKVSLSMKAAYYTPPATPHVEHIAAHMREAALAEHQARTAASASTLQPIGLSSVFLERIRSKIGLDDAALEKIRLFYSLAAGAKVSKNRLGQKARRRLAEEVVGWQRKLRRNERPLTKKQLKKQRRKEEENLRRGILPLTEEEKEEKRKFELAEKKARALRKYDKNKERNKLRKAEERRKREEKEKKEKEERIKAKIFGAHSAADGGAEQQTVSKRQRTQ